MKKANNQQTENALKRFLKKKIAFTTSLLVAFLITGGIGLASSEELASQAAATQDTLIANIEAQKAEIQAMIESNNERLKQLKLDTDELIRKGEWYSKPIYRNGFPGGVFPGAQQVWFSFWWNEDGKAKNKTKSQWSNTLDAIAYKTAGYENPKSINPYAKGEQANGILKSLDEISNPNYIDNEINGNIPEGLSAGDAAAASGKDPMVLLQSGNGAYVHQTPWVEEIDLGANIKPLSPTLPTIGTDVNVSVASPQLTGIVIPNLTVPAAPTAPVITAPTLTAPAAVSPITITAPSAPSPSVPTEKRINVTAPSLPNNYEPTMVVIPTAPSSPIITIPNVPGTDFTAISLGNGDKVYVDCENGVVGMIADIAVLGGEFKVTRSTADPRKYDYQYKDYTAYTWLGPTTGNGAVSGTWAIFETGSPVVQAANVAATRSTTGIKHFTGYDPGSSGMQVVSVGGTNPVNPTYADWNNASYIVTRKSENAATNLNEFAHMDNHGNNKADQTMMENLFENGTTYAVNNGYFTAPEKTKLMAAVHDSTVISQALATATYNERGMIFANSGNIVLEGGNQSLTNQYDHGGTKTNIAINAGEVTIRPFIDKNDNDKLYDSFNAGFLVSQDVSGTAQQLMYNSGNMYFYTNDSAAYVVNSSTGNMIHSVMVNKGKIEMTGKNSLGIFARRDGGAAGTLKMEFTDGAGNRKPIEIFGDSSIGLYITQNFAPSGANVTGNFHVNIGAPGVANKVLNVAAADTNEGGDVTNYYGDNTNTDTIEGTVGILTFKDIQLDSHGIVIYDKTKQCIGVVPLQGASLDIGSGTVQLTGGDSNLGIVGSTIGAYTGGNITGTGNIDMIGGDRNIGTIAQNGHTVTLGSIISSTNEAASNAIGAYANGTGSIVTISDGIGKGNSLKLTIDPASTNDKSTMAAFAKDSGSVIMDIAALPTSANIEITGKDVTGKAAGLALMADNGTISAKNNNIKVVDGAAAIAVVNGGSIDLTGSIVDYSGSGYAIYTDTVATSTVDLTNGEIVLRGKAVGFTLDVSTSPATSHVTFAGSSKITMMSNDAIALNLTGIGTTTLTTLVNTVQTGVNNVSIVAGTEGGTTYDKFRLAATDGGDITIDVPVDKAQDASGPGGVYNPSYFFFRSFLAQKSHLTVANNVTANLTSAQATDIYKGIVSGIEMNSSKSATSVNDSTILVNNNANIIADRTDAGAGAIGMYVNYAKADVSAGSKIQVETGANTVNDSGIGIYAVNGSKATNAGDIEVKGNKAVGILGLSYREDNTGVPKGQEFGPLAVGQGLTDIVNSNNISLDGNSSVSMYIKNNSGAATLPAAEQFQTVSAANSGTITATGDTSVGMYAIGNVAEGGTAAMTTLSNTGTIEVGKDGAGIYVDNGVTINDIGTLKLGEESIGIVMDKDSVFGPGATSATAIATTPTGNKMVLALKSATRGTNDPTAQTIGLNINASTLDNGTAIYILDRGAAASTIESTGTLQIGKKGVGIYVENSHGTNKGTITLDTTGDQAAGMYTQNGTAVNDATGTITVNKGDQIGMVATTANGILENNGTITLNASGATGIFVKDNAKITDTGTITFATGTQNAFGIAANNATVDLAGGTYNLNNADENIYVYGTNGSVINANGNITINGVANADPKKAVGIYLDGTNTLNNLAVLTATTGAIGVYSKGANTFTGGTYAATDDRSVGIYMLNGGTLNNLTVNSGSASGNSIGIYASAGDLNIGTALNLNIGIGGAGGTGIFAVDGASIKGGKIILTNASSTVLPGIYYTGTAAATNEEDIDITGTNETVAIFTDGGANLTNTGTVTDLTGKSIGAVVGVTGGTPATFKNSGVITQSTAGNTAKGMYIINGTGSNASNITMIDGAGVIVDGPNAKFDGTGGNINITGTGTGLALNNTGAGQVINTGNIDLVAGSLGVFADNNAVVDFPVNITGNGATGVYAKAGTTISGTIDSSTATDTIGLYTEDSTVIMNNATIKTGGKNTSASIGWYQGGAGQTYTTAGNTIEAMNDGSVGIYVDNGNTYNFGDTVNVGNGAVGIMTNGAGTTLETNNGTLNIDGGVGIVASNSSVANVGVNGPVNVNFSGNGSVLAYANGGQVNLGSNINILSGSGTLAATLDGSLTNSGTFTVAAGSIGLLGIYDTGSGTILNDSTGNITVNAGGVGLAAKAVSATSSGSPTVKNDNIITVNGANAVGMYANIGTINNTGVVTANDGAIGIYATNTDGPGASITSLGTIDVTKGTGYVIEGSSGSPAPTSTGITLNTGDAANRSIGGFYKNVNGNIDQPTNITTTGEYTIPMAIDGGTNTVTGNISDNASFKNSIGLSVANSTTTVGTVTVNGPESNIGVYGNGSALTTSTVTVGNSTHTADKSVSSIGVYMANGSVSSTDVTAGDDSLGIFGKDSDVQVTGNVTAGKNSLGVYVDGNGSNNGTVTGNVSVDEGALGVYTKNATATVTGNMNVAGNLGIGIVGQGTGDINYNGAATVADKGTTSASIAIYKGAGQGTVNASGTMDIGKGGYAIYADNLTGATGTINVNNSANITLAESAVGIYSGGNVASSNTGNITVGSTYIDPADTTHEDISKFLNSIGMYGEEGAQLENSGTIDVRGSATNDTDHSVGVYLKDNGTIFTNASGGNILVDRGGVGVLAVQNAKVINDGTITVDQTATPVCGGKSIGIGLYSGSTLDNNGTINVNGGYGVYLAAATTYTNNGTMNITDGAGVTGGGTYVNNGTVNVTGGTEIAVAPGEEDPIKFGAITIGNDGSVIIGNQYVGAGTLMSLQPILLDGAMVDITTGKTAFVGDSVNGTISLTSDFITTGNGYSWTAQNFVNSATGIGLSGKINITTSPLYVAHMAGQDLLVAKQPYAYLVTGSQFDNLYNGVDSLLAKDQEGISNDSQVLKKLNAYLDNVYNAEGQEEFDSETGRTLAEMRGDIYATTYKRMETVQNAFDNSFDELFNASNATKDSGKFSVIYQQGKYKDDTLGIDNYDHRVQGLMYMREYESRNYGSKFGYSAGFAVSRFDFDDAPTFFDKSKEDVYSVRVGMHNVHSFGEDDANDRLRLISKIELGYNRHEAVRSMELDELYKNKGNYNSMNVTFDNKLEGTLYRDLKTDVKLYGAINLEYGHIGRFSEKAKGDSALELTVKGQEYLSVQPEVGVQATRKAYIGKKVSAKISGKLAYAYEAGNVGKKARKAKVSGGTEDYYSLIKPDRERGHIKGRVGLTIEKPNGFGVTAEVEVRQHDNKKSPDVRYGIRFNYTF